MKGASAHGFLLPAVAATLTLLALAAWPSRAWAYDARLAWSPVGGAAGYRVYLRETGNVFGAGLDLGSLIPDPDGIVRFVVSGLALGIDYRVAVSAYGTSGMESPRSNELTVALTPPATATATSSATIPPTATSTAPPTASSSATPSATSTDPPPPTATTTPTRTATATSTRTDTATPLPTRTATARATQTATRTWTPTVAPSATASASPSPTPTATALPTWEVAVGSGAQVMRDGSTAVPVAFRGGASLRQIALRLAYDPAVVDVSSAALHLVAGVGTIKLSHPSAGVADVVATLDAPFAADDALFDLTVDAIGDCRATSALHVVSCALDGGADACAPVDGAVEVRCGVAGRIRHWASNAPITGARVQLSADAASPAMLQTTTDALGQFGFAGAAPADGTWRLVPEKSGGLGGAISALDAALVLRAVTGAGSLDEMQRLACDVTGNGTLTALDAARILQVSVGETAHLPAAETCGSDWAFVPDRASGPTAARLISPLVGESSCQQGGIDLDLSAGDPPPQEFLAVPLGDCTGNWTPANTGAVQRVGSARAWLEAPRPRRGGGWLVALRVAGKLDFEAVDARLTVLDGDRPAPAVHAVGAARGSVTALHAESDGHIALALASPATLAADGRPIAILLWRGDTAPHLRLDAVALDEQPIRVR